VGTKQPEVPPEQQKLCQQQKKHQKVTELHKMEKPELHKKITWAKHQE
jgi:hypothetical protein